MLFRTRHREYVDFLFFIIRISRENDSLINYHRFSVRFFKNIILYKIVKFLSIQFSSLNILLLVVTNILK